MTDQPRDAGALRDAAVLGRLVRELAGTCSVCGCHGDSCKLEDGDRCCFVNKLRTLCSNPRCVVEADKQRKNHKYAVRRAERSARGRRKVKGRAA